MQSGGARALELRTAAITGVKPELKKIEFESEVIMCVFQGYPGEDSKTAGPPGPLGEPVGLNFL